MGHKPDEEIRNSIKKYEGKGFEVDLPEIFKRLKRLFWKNEE